MVQAVTTQMCTALRRIGYEPEVVEGFITTPGQAIRRVQPIRGRKAAIFTHWCFAAHTMEGIMGQGKDDPVALLSNLHPGDPGIVAMLNTAACAEAENRPISRLWTAAKDWTKDEAFMARLEEWCRDGKVVYPDEEVHLGVTPSAAADAIAEKVYRAIQLRQILMLMMGDTSMCMFNGYFGPHRLHRVGFAEHKVDQLWFLHRGEKISQARIDRAYEYLVKKGVTFHYGEKGAKDFGPDAVKGQLREYFVVLDLMEEFGAECAGIQYQLGGLYKLPPTDLVEGLLNSRPRPEGNGEPITTGTEADQGNIIPMELMLRLLREKGLSGAPIFHDVRFPDELDGRQLWILLNSGSSSSDAFNHDPNSLVGVHSYRQPKGYFPVPGGTFAGVSLPGEITWARAWYRGDEMFMDVGLGESVELPEETCKAWRKKTTPEWPFMAADLHCDTATILAHLYSNHLAAVYGNVRDEMVALSRKLGFTVRVLSRN